MKIGRSVIQKKYIIKTVARNIQSRRQRLPFMQFKD